MSRIEEVLNKYEDWEIAYFAKYMLDSYTEGTQNKLKEYIKTNRGIEINRIDELIKNQSQTITDKCIERCPRCKSDKFMSEFVDFYRTSVSYNETTFIKALTRKKTQKEQITCQVCGYLIVNPNNEKWTRQTEKSLLDKIISKLKTIRK